MGRIRQSKTNSPTEIAQGSQEIAQVDHGQERNFWLSQGYMDGWVRVEIFGRSIGPEIEPCHWAVIFEYAGIQSNEGWGETLGQSPPHIAYVQDSGGDEQESMFVDVVQPGESPQGMNGRSLDIDGSICSSVRLRRLQGVQEVSGPDRGVELRVNELAIFVVGELSNGVVRILPGRLAAVGQTDLPRELIKARPEVIEDFSDNDGPFRINEREIVDYRRILSGLRIELKGEGICVGVEPGFDGFLHLDRISLRPGELCVDLAEVYRRHHSLTLEAHGKDERRQADDSIHPEGSRDPDSDSGRSLS
jgi:hypothetical protein